MLWNSRATAVQIGVAAIRYLMLTEVRHVPRLADVVRSGVPLNHPTDALPLEVDQAGVDLLPASDLPSHLRHDVFRVLVRILVSRRAVNLERDRRRRKVPDTHRLVFGRYRVEAD